MARLIQQRKSSPPYLLILFVFLFLVSTVVAVLAYLDGDKAKKEAKDAGGKIQALAGPEIETPTVQAMMEQYKRPEGGGVSVVGQMQQKTERLTQLLTGDAKSATAETQADKAFARIGGSRPGLASAVLGAYDKIDELNGQLKAKDGEIASIKKDLDAKTKEVATLGQDRAKERDELNQKVADLDKKLAEAQADREKAVAALNDERTKEIASRDKEIAEKNKSIERLDKENQRLEKENRKLKEGERGPVGPEIVRKPNGRILRTGGEAAAYIGLGAKDRVRPGMTFNVYPSTGIPQDPNDAKAKILVTSVGEKDDFSTCRIILLRDKANPVMSNDVIYNVVYDPTRTYKFVVVGLFDIYGTRRLPDVQGAEEVRNLVQRFGGSVQPEVTPDTDYLVFGEKPSAPKAAEEGATAPPPSPEIEKARQQYDDAMEKAAKYKIPFLNTNRFLAMTGFEPSITTAGR